MMTFESARATRKHAPPKPLAHAKAARPDPAPRGGPLGHHFASIALARTTLSGPPIQAVLGRRPFLTATQPGAQRNQIAAAIRTYNQGDNPRDNAEAHLHRQLAALDNVEHLTYAFSHQIDFTSAVPAMRAQAGAVSTLLDEIQRDHRDLIARTVLHKRQLWVHGAPNPAERASINATWNELVAGNGAFRVSDETNDTRSRVRIPGAAKQELHTEILASSARLLSRPHGRRLVTRLREGAGQRSWLARTLQGAPSHDRPVNFEVTNLYALRAGDLNYKAYDGEGEEGPKTVGGALARGNGAKSLVKVSPGIRDATLLDTDNTGRRIVSPSFVGFGHELIHAARYQRGAYVKGAHPAAALPPAYHDDVEEFLTIASATERANVPANVVPVDVTAPGGTQTVNSSFAQIAALSGDLPTEAEIRAEHGLEIRHGHGAPIANPVTYPGGLGSVTETSDWEARHIGGAATPIAAPQNLRTRVTRRIRDFVRTRTRKAVAIGSLIAVSYLLSLGYKAYAQSAIASD